MSVALKTFAAGEAAEATRTVFRAALADGPRTGPGDAAEALATPEVAETALLALFAALTDLTLLTDGSNASLTSGSVHALKSRTAIKVAEAAFLVLTAALTYGGILLGFEPGLDPGLVT